MERKSAWSIPRAARLATRPRRSWKLWGKACVAPDGDARPREDRACGTIFGRTMSLTRSKPGLKAKKSYTLSPRLLPSWSRCERSAGRSRFRPFWRRFLQDVRREQEKASVERAVADYYSSLADNELEERARWSEFALAEFPKEEGA